MKGKISKEGVLHIQRGSILKDQLCINNKNLRCWDFCPQFGEPHRGDAAHEVACIRICGGRVLCFEEFEDEREGCSAPVAALSVPDSKPVEETPDLVKHVANLREDVALLNLSIHTHEEPAEKTEEPAEKTEVAVEQNRLTGNEAGEVSDKTQQ